MLLNGLGPILLKIDIPSLWRDAEKRVVRLTISELQLFLEGSTLVGRVALSPASFIVADERKDLASRIRR